MAHAWGRGKGQVVAVRDCAWGEVRRWGRKHLQPGRGDLVVGPLGGHLLVAH